MTSREENITEMKLRIDCRAASEALYEFYSSNMTARDRQDKLSINKFTTVNNGKT